jgi:hypothetical protein
MVPGRLGAQMPDGQNHEWHRLNAASSPAGDRKRKMMA